MIYVFLFFTIAVCLHSFAQAAQDKKISSHTVFMKNVAISEPKDILIKQELFGKIIDISCPMEMMI